jgi:hypothetical protein
MESPPLLLLVLPPLPPLLVPLVVLVLLPVSSVAPESMSGGWAGELESLEHA